MNDAELQAALAAEMRKRAVVIETPLAKLPPFSPQDAAVPFVKVSDGVLHWIVVERGEVLQHRETRDVHEWLYWVFNAVARDSASRWELTHRIEHVEFRLPRFCRHLELLARLDEGWADDTLASYWKTFESSPYDADDYPRDDAAPALPRRAGARRRGAGGGRRGGDHPCLRTRAAAHAHPGGHRDLRADRLPAALAVGRPDRDAACPGPMGAPAAGALADTTTSTRKPRTFGYAGSLAAAANAVSSRAMSGPAGM